MQTNDQNNYRIHHRRGNRLVSASEYSTLIKSERDRDVLHPRPSFAGYTLPYEMGSENFLVVGRPGSGKTTLLDMLADSVITGHIGSGKDHRAVIHDHKGESIQLLYGLGCTFENGLLKTFNPFDERAVAWDIAKDIDNAPFARSFAEIMIPINQNDSNPFWANTARNLLSGIVRSFIKMFPYQWALRDLVHVSLYSSLDELCDVLAWEPRNRGLVARLKGKAGETIEGALWTLQTEMEKYVEIAALWYRATEKISIRHFLANDYVILLGSYHRCEQAMTTVNQLFLSRLIDEVIPAGGGCRVDALNNRRLWLLLDEGAKVGRLDKLPMLLDLGRQMGVVVAFAIHNLQQLQEVYGENSKALLSQFGNVAVLRVGDRETAEWASDLFGNQEVFEERLSFTRSVGSQTFIKESHGPWGNESSGQSLETSVRELKVVLPEELLSLPRVSSETGIRGYLHTHVGLTKIHLPWQALAGKRPIIDTNVASFIEVDLIALEFPFWNEQ
jgi:type IV secretory pathway TraG/TraD family ATPase VirD4